MTTRNEKPPLYRKVLSHNPKSGCFGSLRHCAGGHEGLQPAPQPPGTDERTMREVVLELQKLSKFKLFLEHEVAKSAAGANTPTAHSLQQELRNVQMLEECLEKQAAVLSSRESLGYALRLFMSKFEYGP